MYRCVIIWLLDISCIALPLFLNRVILCRWPWTLAPLSKPPKQNWKGPHTSQSISLQLTVCFLWMEIEPSPNNNAEQLPFISIMEERILGLLRSGKTGCSEGLHPEFITGTYEDMTLKCCSLTSAHTDLHTCPCIYISIFIYTIQIIYIHTYVIYPHIYNNLLKKRN